MDPHRTREPQAELCLLTLENITRAERLGTGSRPGGPHLAQGLWGTPSTPVTDLWPRPTLEMDFPRHGPPED